MKPYYESTTSEAILKEAERDYKNAIIGYRRAKALESWMLKNIDPEIEAKYTIRECLRNVEMYIYLKKDDEDSMIKLIEWFKSLKNKKFKVKKLWSEHSGTFYYKMTRQYNGDEYQIFFKDGFDIDGCKVIEKKKIVKYYVTDCETERQLV